MTGARVEQIGDCTMYLGDCREVLPTLGKIDAVVTDPPYGMAWNTNSSRFTGGTYAAAIRGNDDWGHVQGDDAEFDPGPWLQFKEVILWGANHFANRLPKGTTLVWLKKHDTAFGSFLSDGEIAWQRGGHGIYCRRDTSLKAEPEKRLHPTQKPVGIMSWCIERTKSSVILDPYAGSGTTGVACIKQARKFVGVEIDIKYFDIACKRLEEASRQSDLFKASRSHCR